MNAPNVLELRFASEDTLNEAVSQRVVGQLTTALRGGREASLVVSGGRSPVALFHRLREAPLDWSRVWITLADERWVDPGDPASNESFVRRELLQSAAARAHFVGLKNTAPDAVAGAARSTAALAALPRPFDAVVLGMGEDGHFASLFPNSPGLTDALDPSGAPACVPMLASATPRERISLNLAALLEARLLLLPLQGVAKAATLRAASAEGPADTLPVRALLRQGRVPLEIYCVP
jgi:6-phosphogluconolactonase